MSEVTKRVAILHSVLHCWRPYSAWSGSIHCYLRTALISSCSMLCLLLVTSYPTSLSSHIVFVVSTVYTHACLMPAWLRTTGVTTSTFKGIDVVLMRIWLHSNKLLTLLLFFRLQWPFLLQKRTKLEYTLDIAYRVSDQWSTVMNNRTHYHGRHTIEEVDVTLHWYLIVPSLALLSHLVLEL